MIRSAGFLAIALLMSCAPVPEPIAAGQFSPDLVSRAEADCTARGGRWGQGGLAGGFVCYQSTRDGGQTCAASTDCEGLCLARSRSCSPVTPLFGCNEVLTRLGGRATICVD